MLLAKPGAVLAVLSAVLARRQLPAAKVLANAVGEHGYPSQAYRHRFRLPALSAQGDDDDDAGAAVNFARSRNALQRIPQLRPDDDGDDDDNDVGAGGRFAGANLGVLRRQNKPAWRSDKAAPFRKRDGGTVFVDPGLKVVSSLTRSFAQSKSRVASLTRSAPSLVPDGQT